MVYRAVVVVIAVSFVVSTLVLLSWFEFPESRGAAPLEPPPRPPRPLAEERSEQPGDSSQQQPRKAGKKTQLRGKSNPIRVEPSLVSKSVSDALRTRGSVPGRRKTRKDEDILTVDHGAWILPKRALPRTRRDETSEAFNDRLVEAIIGELSKAWPPRVVRPFSRALTTRLMAMDLARSRELEKNFAGRSGGNPAKVAFLFLVGSDEIATEPLWRAFFATEYAKARASIFVHPPPGVALPERSFFAPYALQRRVRVSWGSLAMVHAEVLLLSAALRDPSNQRFVLLSETDVPLWPFRCTYGVLTSVPDRSFLETRRTLERFDMWDFKEVADGVRFVTPDQWRKGSQWFALSRPDARRVAQEGRLRRWYEAHARRQLDRSKVRRMGPLAAMRHIAFKPNFADEHFVQTTLARAASLSLSPGGGSRESENGRGPEVDTVRDGEGKVDTVLAASLTSATFGRENEFSVWGDGLRHEFRLDAAEWHAVQFGALDVAALDVFHRLCHFNVSDVAPLEPLDAGLEAKRTLSHMSDAEFDADPEGVQALRALADEHRREKLERKNSKKNRKNGQTSSASSSSSSSDKVSAGPRVLVGDYEPSRLACSLGSRAPDTHPPCFLFARKIHAEAVDYYGQLLATYFLEKADPSVADALHAARELQRDSARVEVAAVLSEGDAQPGAPTPAPVQMPDYAVRDMHNLLAVLSASDFFGDTPALDLSAGSAAIDDPSDDDARRLDDLDDFARGLRLQINTSRHYIWNQLPDHAWDTFQQALDADKAKPRPRDVDDPNSPWNLLLDQFEGRVPDKKPPKKKKKGKKKKKTKPTASSSSSSDTGDTNGEESGEASSS